ncbi:lipopolysaccharide biosynthesis protein [Roseburia sp. 499]|uniref:lipopolysaccharide biosynthesis protein n=1 Tax=Roseburia sp. 499 TaxID=1261634 RepID=UPI00095229CE|nr:oligosaccharide flippase family protein [Roseburia sp. 499]WVK69294.1 oligosaccharide flippase family protein [Roseburia sp. 499]
MELKRKMKKKVLDLMSQNKYRNIFWSMLSKAIITILYFIGDILIARMLSLSEYGEWAFFYSIISILFWIAWFGLNISSKIYVAKCGENEKLRSKYIKVTLKVRVFVSSIFFLIFLLITSPLALQLGYPQKYINLKSLLFIGCFLTFANSMNEYYKEQFLGLNKFKKITVLAVAEYGGYVLFSYIGILIFRNSLGVALGYLVALIMSSVIGNFMLRDEYDREVAIDKLEARKKAKEVIKYALPILIISFGALILLEMDTLMIGMLGDKEDIALYSIAKKIVSKAVSVNDAFCAGVIVTFAVITPENVLEKEREYKKLIKENTLLTLIITIGMIVLGPVLITYMYGLEYQYASVLLLMLMPYYIITALSHFFASIMDFQSMAKERSYYFWITIVINFVLNFTLIPRWNSVGATIATIVSVIPYAVLTFRSNLVIFKKYKNRRKENDIC